MRLIVPLPFGELAISIRRTKRARPLFWYTLLSGMLHVLLLTAVARFFLSVVLPPNERQPTIVVSSSALRIERSARPQPARQPSQSPPQPLPRPHAATQPQPTAQPPPPSRLAEHREPIVKTTASDRVAAQLQRDALAFAQTAARLSAKGSPLAGIATPAPMPASARRDSLDISGANGKPQPEGILYPLKRWTDGEYAYYYVRYLVHYDDGTIETGSVPWPIRFPLDEDPFAHGINHMPLPGPPASYVLPGDVPVTPLVRNCYAHRYQYCPIERAATP